MRLRECKIRTGKSDCDLCKRSNAAPITETQFPQSEAEKGRMHWIDLCADCIDTKRQDPREFAALTEFVKYPASPVERSPRVSSRPLVQFLIPAERAPRTGRRKEKAG